MTMATTTTATTTTTTVKSNIATKPGTEQKARGRKEQPKPLNEPNIIELRQRDMPLYASYILYYNPIQRNVIVKKRTASFSLILSYARSSHYTHKHTMQCGQILLPHQENNGRQIVIFSKGLLFALHKKNWFRCIIRRDRLSHVPSMQLQQTNSTRCSMKFTQTFRYAHVYFDILFLCRRRFFHSMVFFLSIM